MPIHLRRFHLHVFLWWLLSSSAVPSPGALLCCWCFTTTTTARRAWKSSTAKIRVTQPYRSVATQRKISVLFFSRVVDDTDDIACEDRLIIERQLGYFPRNFVCVSARTKKNGSPIAIKTYPLNGGAPRRQRKAMASLEKSESTPLVAASSIKGLGTPFPTLYWLTCPKISKAIAELERDGYISYIQDYINDGTHKQLLQKQLYFCHQNYAKERWNSLTQEDKEILLLNNNNTSIQRMRQILQYSGIAGAAFSHSYNNNNSNYEINDNYDNENNCYRQEKERDQLSSISSLKLSSQEAVSIKCLHGHYAHFRSTTSADTATLNSNTLNSNQDTPFENPVGRIVHEILSKKFQSLEL